MGREFSNKAFYTYFELFKFAYELGVNDGKEGLYLDSKEVVKDKVRKIVEELETCGGDSIESYLLKMDVN